MKISMLMLAMLAFGFAAQAQVSIPKTDVSSLTKDFIKPPAIGDISKTTSGIMGMLGGLKLSDAQKPKISEAISGFLGQKQGILGLADKNPADYLKKFNPLQQGLFGKLKGIMGAETFSKFLGLKPTGKSIGTSLLSNLFF